MSGAMCSPLQDLKLLSLDPIIQQGSGLTQVFLPPFPHHSPDWDNNLVFQSMSAQNQGSSVEFRVGEDVYQTWYKVTGDVEPSSGGKTPLVALHGGPGMSHHYML